MNARDLWRDLEDQLYNQYRLQLEPEFYDQLQEAVVRDWPPADNIPQFQEIDPP